MLKFLLENDSVFVSSQSILTDSIELQPDTLTPIDSLILIYRERLSQNQYLEDTLNHLKGPYRDIAEDISGHIRYQYNYDSRRDSEKFRCHATSSFSEW